MPPKKQRITVGGLPREVLWEKLCLKINLVLSKYRYACMLGKIEISIYNNKYVSWRDRIWIKSG